MPKFKPKRTLTRWLWTVVVVAGLLAFNVPPAIALTNTIVHEWKVNSNQYKSKNGYWETIELPENLEVNAIHAAMLPTGKLLLVAGSGNDRNNFEAGSFKTLVYDPEAHSTHLVSTPADLFCSGHTYLGDGKLLVAGGTLRYEILQGQVVKAGGTMTIKNENPDKGIHLASGTERDGLTPAAHGTRITGPNGKVYLTDSNVDMPPASRRQVIGMPDIITASEQQVFVVALEPGPDSVVSNYGQYVVQGLSANDTKNVYGLAEKITLDKQDYQGIKDTYEFNPWTETYEKVGDMVYGRWYPTTVGLPDGHVMAISGLDQSGKILDGQTEIYDPATKKWTERDNLRMYFPTYPAVFQTQTLNQLFYSGSSTGYGPANQGRQPGFWNLNNNTFKPVAGLRDQNQTETSASAWVGPVNHQKLMIVGGGGVGESPLSTSRIDTINLASANPHYSPGPSLLKGTRYPSLATLPNDDTLITGGSVNYRGKGNTDTYESYLFHAGNSTLTQVADHSVGRNYHSSAVLLPTGQVLTVGSDPLFGDAAGNKPGKFERRLEIYSPPYLFQESGDAVTRPVIISGPDQVQHGMSAIYKVGTQAGNSPPNIKSAPIIMSARLIWPSAVTHVTDTNTRSVDVGAVQNKDGSMTISIPADPTITPTGWYMLFANDANGVPSVARWVHVN